jgi:hypothetical protein
MLLPNPREEPTVPVERAGQILGLGRSASYEAAARGEIPTLRFGRRLVVPSARLIAMLGFDDPKHDDGAPKSANAATTDAPCSREDGRGTG